MKTFWSVSDCISNENIILLFSIVEPTTWNGLPLQLHLMPQN